MSPVPKKKKPPPTRGAQVKFFSAPSGIVKPQDVQQVGEYIIKHVSTGSFDEVTAEMIVDAADRNPTCPLHKYIYDGKSNVQIVREYRLERARSLLRSISYEFTTRPGRKIVGRAWEIVRDENTGKTKYGNTFKLMNDDTRRQELLERAREELQRWVDKYEQYQELADAATKAKLILSTL